MPQTISSWNDLRNRVSVLEEILSVQGTLYPEFPTFADLPIASSVPSRIFLVQHNTGLIGFRNLAGLYQSQETAPSVWNWFYLGYDRDALSIKTRYESNPDTNAFTNSFKSKLEFIKVHYIHSQTVANSIWNINHNLDYYPNVSTVNSSNIRTFGQIEYVDANNVKITFYKAGILFAVSGFAYLS